MRLAPRAFLSDEEHVSLRWNFPASFRIELIQLNLDHRSPQFHTAASLVYLPFPLLLERFFGVRLRLFSYFPWSLLGTFTIRPPPVYGPLKVMISPARPGLEVDLVGSPEVLRLGGLAILSE